MAISYNITSASAGSYSYADTKAKSATILESKKDGSTWRDVTKVAWNGDTFEIGEYVETMAHVGRIIGLTPLNAEVSMLTLEFPVNVPYSSLKRLSKNKIGELKLNPNEAFKHKKKTGRY